ncbi:MAG: 4'-phosphopantetheinyl transferase superfamily protein [Ruminococcus sp.]|nr:4'-phosphopantetheinyl transferase superfamily protein [Ruminococcus sp.]
MILPERMRAVSSSSCDKCRVYLFTDIENVSGNDLEKWRSLLSDERLRRSEQYRFFRDRRTSVLVYLLLRIAVYEDTGRHTAPEFSLNKYGKPYIIGIGDIFSISHCTKAVMCAYGCKCGCDVQDNEPALKPAAETIMTVDEKIAAGSDIRELLRIWTMKEAYGKYIGKGLNYNTGEASFARFTGNDGTFAVNDMYLHSVTYGELAYSVFSENSPVVIKLSYEEFCEKCSVLKR